MVEDKDTVTIVVNGRERVVPSNELSSDGGLSFKQVVSLAFDPPPSGPEHRVHRELPERRGEAARWKARCGSGREDSGGDGLQCLIH